MSLVPTRGLTWDKVDRKHETVKLEPGETKNDEGRTVYLDAKLQAAFNHQWELRKRSRKLTPYVLPNEDNDCVHFMQSESFSNPFVLLKVRQDR